MTVHAATPPRHDSLVLPWGEGWQVWCPTCGRSTIHDTYSEALIDKGGHRR